MSDYRTINPYEVILSNQGYMRIDGFDIAELKNLKITVTPEIKKFSMINSATQGSIITSLTGKITFEINKIYSRFKPTVLECYKYLLPFTFNLEATVRNYNKTTEESIYIGTCWLEGDIDIFELNADTDFLSEKYEAGFRIEDANFSDIIEDGLGDWKPLGFLHTSDASNS